MDPQQENQPKAEISSSPSQQNGEQDEEERTSSNMKKKANTTYNETQITEYIIKFGRGLLAILMVWLTGWFGFSHAWILGAYVIYVFWSKKKAERAKKWDALRFFSDYDNLKKVKHLPSWVSS